MEEIIINTPLDTASPTPIYRQLRDRIACNIAQGTLPPGQRLPAVTLLAGRSGISPGTVKHAYDQLERDGLIKKKRGSGTFVSFPKKTPQSDSKALAMSAIDLLLNKMEKLSISPRELRAFLDLKLRERGKQTPKVTVAVVECCPEALLVMYRQLLEIPHAEVYQYLLAEILEQPAPFAPPTDLVITTPTHYEALSRKMLHRRSPSRLVMAIATSTALELAALPPTVRLGIACASRRFAQSMLRACGEYGTFRFPVEAAYFGDEDRLRRLIRNCSRLLLPPNYECFASPAEAQLLHSVRESHRPIHYRYQVEQGSLLYLEETIARYYQTKGLSPRASA